MNKIKNKFNSYNSTKLIFLTVFLCGLLCYWLAMISGFQHPDGINEGLFEYKSIDWEISCGRWMIPVLNALTRNIVIPPLYVIIYLSFIALSLLFLARHFHITDNIYLAVLACLMTANPNVIGHLQFMFTTQIYSFALLTSTMFITFIPKKKILNAVIGIVCMTIAMGCYQSYIGFAAAGCALTLMMYLVDGQKLKTVIYTAVKYICCVGISAFLYYICLRIAMIIRDIDYSSTRLANGTGVSKEQLFKATRRCYRLTKEYFFDETLGRNWFNGGIACILTILIVASLVVIYRQSKEATSQDGLRSHSKRSNIFRCMIYIILVVTFPIACFIFHLITPGEGVHELMMYQLVFFYVMAFALLSRLPLADISSTIVIDKEAIKSQSLMYISKYIADITHGLLVLCALCITWTYFISANATFRCYQLDYQNAISRTQIVMSQIYQLDNYSPDKKMVIIGEPDNTDLENFYQMYRYAVKTGDGRIINGGLHGQMHHWPQFIMAFTGHTVNWTSQDEYFEIIDTPEFSNMTVWPSCGSIKEINDIIVVKMTEEPIR